MRHFPFPVVLVALGLSVAAVPAAPPAAEPTAARVAALIGQLGSPEFRAREAASRELVAVGEPALSAVRVAATTSEDREVARRAAEIAEQIADDVDTARTLAPALVELSVEKKPLLAVLSDLHKQTGYTLGVTGSGTAAIPVTVKTAGKVPFWMAVEAVCTAAGVHIVADPTTLRSGITYAGGAAEPTPPDEQPLDPARAGAMHAEAAKAYTKAVQDRVRATDAAEKQRLDQEVTKRRAELLKVVRQVAELASRPSPTGPRPVPPVPVLLRPRVGVAPPSSVRGAVRVEVAPIPATAAEALPPDVVPVMLHIAAEPRLKLERVESVRVTQAIDDAGRDLKSLPAADPAARVALPYPVAANGANVVLGPNGRLDLVAGKPTGSSSAGSPWQVLVRLKAEESPPASLRRLDGAVRAVVRSGPGELVTLTGLNSDRGVSATANDVGLSVSAVTPTTTAGEFSLDVTTHYKPAVVQATGGVSGGTTEMVFVQNGGRVIVRRQIAGRVVINGPGAGWGTNGSAGVTVRGPDGRPLAANVARRDQRVASTGALTETLKLTVTGEPASVVFTGTRAKVVEVPFLLADVFIAGRRPSP